MDQKIEIPQPVAVPTPLPTLKRSKKILLIGFGIGAIVLLAVLGALLSWPYKHAQVGKLVLPTRSSAEVATLVKNNQKPVVISGTFIEEHGDNFNGIPTQDVNYIKDDNGVHYKVKLHDEKQNIVPNSKITLSGIQSTTDSQKTIDVDPAVSKPVTTTTAFNTPGFTGDNNVIVTKAPPDTILKPTKMAVVLVNFTQEKTTPFTPNDIDHALYDTPLGVNNYLKEASYNQISLIGKNKSHADVFGYYSVDGGDATTCDYYSYATDADNQAKLDGIDLVNDYDHVMYILPLADKCKFIGLGELGGRRTWMRGNINMVPLVHELGHNFNMHHASGLICKDENGLLVPYSANCTSDEYGDDNDVMGRSSGQYNGYHKAQAGWLSGDRIETIAQSGHYSVTPLENLGKRVLSRIPVGVDYNGYYTYLYFDYRYPIGFFDTGILESKNGGFRPLGLSIYIAKDVRGRSQQTTTIDATPNTATFYDSDWQAGSTFEDKVHNISIRIDKLDSLSADFTVTMPGSLPTNNDILTYTNPSNIYTIAHSSSIFTVETVTPIIGEEQIWLSHYTVSSITDDHLIDVSMLHTKQAPKDWYQANIPDAKGPTDTTSVNGYTTFHKQGCDDKLCFNDYVLRHNGVLLLIRFNQKVFGKDDRGIPTTDDRSQYGGEFDKLVNSIKFK